MSQNVRHFIVFSATPTSGNQQFLWLLLCICVSVELFSVLFKLLLFLTILQNIFNELNYFLYPNLQFSYIEINYVKCKILLTVKCLFTKDFSNNINESVNVAGVIDKLTGQNER